MKSATSSRHFGPLIPALYLLLSLGTPSDSLAQTLQGRVIDPDTHLPIEGVLVLLIDHEGEEKDGYFTNVAGWFLLEAPGPGQYTVKAERIGYGTSVTDPIEVAGEEPVAIQVEMSVSPIRLSEIEVRGEQRCEIRPEEGLELARVWDEARKALSIQEWTERARIHAYEVSTFRRRMNSGGDRILREEREEVGVLDQMPFRSLPAEELMEEGFIGQIRRSANVYYAPDASVLLSDAFLDTHCFRLTESDTLPGLLGLAFEPLETQPRTADIRGVLWLDRETSELDFLEFRYAWRRLSRGKDQAGGRVDFQQLPSGAWIVRSWSIVMPTLRAYQEMGAEVRDVSSMRTVLPTNPELGDDPSDSMTPLVAPSIDGDTLEIDHQVRWRVANYYTDRLLPTTFRPDVLAAQRRCSADRGHLCFGGDPDGHLCHIDEECHRNRGQRGQLLEFLSESARAHPSAGFVVGYATYQLSKFDRHAEAFEIAGGCASAEWWCQLLLGYVFQRTGQPAEAEARFQQSLTTAPDSIACLLTDASWALPGRDRNRLQAVPCEARKTASDTVWWLADPLYSVPGNGRWAEHVSRSLATRFFYFEVIYSLVSFGQPMPKWQQEWLLKWRIPRGTWDSWTWRDISYPQPNSYHFDAWTSERAARYHFIPDFEVGDFSRPVWRIEGSLQDEGYTPPDGPFYELPAQVARFRRADSMLVAVAGTISGSGLAEASDPLAHLVLSDGPGSFPLRLSSRFTDRRAVFLGQAAADTLVLSFEAVSQPGNGRHRVMLEPLDTEGPGVSDLLLYRPIGTHDPDSLLIAAGMMMGEVEVDRRDRVGVFWETYGGESRGPVRVEMEVRRERQGLVDAVRRILPGGGVGGTGRLSWEEPELDSGSGNSVILEFQALEPGRYTLLLRTWWEGQEPLETERTFRLR